MMALSRTGMEKAFCSSYNHAKLLRQRVRFTKSLFSEFCGIIIIIIFINFSKYGFSVINYRNIV